MKFLIVVAVLILGIVFFESGQKTKINNLIATPLPSPTLTSTPSSTNNQQVVSELKIEDEKVGTGSAVKSGDTIVVNYKGTLLDGTKFDSSYDRGQPFETQIGVGQVIKGWDVGIIGMKVGGKRKLTIPSNLAYGEQGAGGAIPPNAPLIFEIELLSIK